MKRRITLIAFGFLLIVVPRALARRQTGNIDSCDQFYRFAKQYLHEWDYTLPQDEIQKLNSKVNYSPIQSLAYSQLYTACMLRNTQVQGR